MLDLQICFQGDDLPRAIEKTWVRPCDLFYDFSFACMYVDIIKLYLWAFPLLILDYLVQGADLSGIQVCSAHTAVHFNWSGSD